MGMEWEHAQGKRGTLVYMAALLLCSSTSFAAEINLEQFDLRGSWDTTISYGAAWRTESQDPDLTAQADSYPELVERNIRTQANRNDGDSNFEPGLVSHVIKLTTELDLQKGNDSGLFLRAKAFYDDVIMGNHYDGDDNIFNNNFQCGDRFCDEVKDHAGRDVVLLGAYVWKDFDLRGHLLNVRLGEQVLNWGETLFLQDGISSSNPKSLAALRLPGAEVREALLPIPMLYAQYEATDLLSVEAFYAFGWDKSEPDDVGTFLSTTDALFGEGANRVLVDMDTDSSNESLQLVEQITRAYNSVYRSITDATDPRATQLTLEARDDVEPADSGQFGLGARYFAPRLNNTEFGFYFMNYHNQKPTAGAVLGEANGVAVDVNTCAVARGVLAQATGDLSFANPDNFTCEALNSLAGTAGQIVGAINGVHFIDSTTYFRQYEEDIKLYGISFNTNIDVISFSGELAYRPDYPLIPIPGDTLVALNSVNALRGTIASGGCDVYADDFSGQHLTGSGAGGCFTAGEVIDVSDTVESFNLALVAINTLGPTWAFDDVAVALEAGMMSLRGLDAGKRYAAEGALSVIPGVLEEGEANQYLSRTSWGYRLVLSGLLNNAVHGANLNPVLRLAHDVNGNSPVGGNFVEGRKSATLALNVDYLKQWQFSIGATAFWGANAVNQLRDRDHAFFDVKYTF